MMPDLSPAAQAILDAWESEWSKGSLCHDQRSIAAALRAAAVYCTHERRILMTIAAELEQRTE